MTAKAFRASAPRIVRDLPPNATPPRYGLNVITAERCPFIGGGMIFGADRLRIGACPGSLKDAKTERYLRGLDRALEENEKAVGWTVHREQLAWVFLQLVRTADALGLPVSDGAAVRALDKRLGGTPLGEAMVICVWTFTLVERTPKWERARGERFQDTLEDSVKYARAFLAGRKIKTPARLRADAWVREVSAASEVRRPSKRTPLKRAA